MINSNQEEFLRMINDPAPHGQPDMPDLAGVRIGFLSISALACPVLLLLKSVYYPSVAALLAEGLLQCIHASSFDTVHEREPELQVWRQVWVGEESRLPLHLKRWSPLVD